MTNNEAIKYLKQLYPYGGHCWLDEQRIEAIGMAVSAIEFKEKVRAEIERRMNELYNKLPNGNEVINGAVTIPDANITGKYTALEGLLSFIDSMQLEEIPPKFPLISQKKCMFTKDSYTDDDRKVLCEDCKEKKCEYSNKEEPVSIWHDASEEPNGDNSIVIAYDNGCTVEPSFKDFKSYSEYVTIKKSYRVKQWAYVNDVLNLTNKEEPVSEDLNTELEKYIKDHFTIDTEQLDRFGIEEKDYMYSMDKSDMLALVEHFTNWQKQKDSIVSEDLEKAINFYIENNFFGSETLGFFSNRTKEEPNDQDIALAFKAGAQWQKEQMMKEIKSRLVYAATKQDNSTDIGGQTYYNGMVDALGRLRDKFMED